MASKDINDNDVDRREFKRLIKDFIADTEPLDKFSLECSHKKPDLVTRSIWSAINKNVRFLRASVMHDIDIFLPNNLFTCPTLESLELEGCLFVDPANDVQIHLPRLENLKLVDVRYRNGDTLTRFISGCPVLQSLHLQMRVCNDPDDDSETLDFTLSSPSLRHLKLVSSSDSITLELPSLEDARIGAYFTPNSLEGMVGALSRVKTLTISEEVFTLLADEIGSLQFERLTTLIVTAACSQWNALFDMLRRSPNLRVLRFNKVRCSCPAHAPWAVPNDVPVCLSRPIQVFISGIQGFDDELAVVAYILQHATDLKLHVNKIPRNRNRR